MERLVLFLVLLIVWAVASAALYFVSLLSVSTTIIATMLGLCVVCLLVAIVSFFARRMTAAFLFASGPFLVIAGLLALSQFAGLIYR